MNTPSVPVLLFIVPDAMVVQPESAVPVIVEPSDIDHDTSKPLIAVVPVAADTPGPDGIFADWSGATTIESAPGVRPVPWNFTAHVPSASHPFFRAVNAPSVPVLLVIVPAEMNEQLASAVPLIVDPSESFQVISFPFTVVVPVAGDTPGADGICTLSSLATTSDRSPGVRPVHWKAECHVPSTLHPP